MTVALHTDGNKTGPNMRVSRRFDDVTGIKSGGIFDGISRNNPIDTTDVET
jgi:hypothetical protein